MRLKLRRYRLYIEDEGSLLKVWGVRISRLRLILTTLCCFVLAMMLGVTIVFFTPLKRRLPGFLTDQDRGSLISALGRLDSLNMQLAENQAYIDNFSTILDTERQSGDSLLLSSKVVPLPLDSLKTASPQERAFVSAMTQQQRYNLNVLTPVAADAVVFVNPSETGIVDASSRQQPVLKMILPLDQGLKAISDGYVIDAESNDAGDDYNSLIVQSKRGFLTRYTCYGKLLVDKGHTVLAGQYISLPPNKKSAKDNSVSIEMWREGVRLIPGDYLMQSTVMDSSTDMTVPRGK